MIGEPDAGKPPVRFDEGRQETCVRAARLSPTLQSPQSDPAGHYSHVTLPSGFVLHTQWAAASEFSAWRRRSFPMRSCV